MKIEDYCKEKGYSISEVKGNLYDMPEEFILGLISKKDKIYPETEIRKKLEVEKIIIPSENGKKIVFAEDWNRQCHLSSLFLSGDFYLAIDRHSDMIRKEGIADYPVYDCGNYRNFVLKNCSKNNRKMILITTENLEDFSDRKYYEKYASSLHYKRLDRPISMESLKEELKSKIKNKKGVLCLDYDILCPEEIKKYGLDEMYSKMGGIKFEDLKEIIKTILNISKVETFFITIPHKRKDFLEALLE